VPKPALSRSPRQGGQACREWVRTALQMPASSTRQARSKAASRGTEVEHVGSPPDLLRSLVCERPEQACQKLQCPRSPPQWAAEDAPQPQSPSGASRSPASARAARTSLSHTAYPSLRSASVEGQVRPVAHRSHHSRVPQQADHFTDDAQGRARRRPGNGSAPGGTVTQRTWVARIAQARSRR
jgi:hypothetical protein